MTHHSKCPNCGRTLTEDEIYCYFCELEISKTPKVLDDARKLEASEIEKMKKYNYHKRKNEKNSKK